MAKSRDSHGFTKKHRKHMKRSCAQRKKRTKKLKATKGMATANVRYSKVPKVTEVNVIGMADYKCTQQEQLPPVKEHIAHADQDYPFDIRILEEERPTHTEPIVCKETEEVIGYELKTSKVLVSYFSKTGSVSINRVNPNRIDNRAAKRVAGSNKDKRLARMAKRTARKLQKKAA